MVEEQQRGGEAGVQEAEPLYFFASATTTAAIAPTMAAPAPTPTRPSLMISFSAASSKFAACRKSGLVSITVFKMRRASMYWRER